MNLLPAVVTVAALLALPMAGHAHAPYAHWGVDLLGTELVEDDDAFTGAVDDTSGSLRIHGGYRANRWLGLEGSIQGLGSYSTGDDNRFDYSAATLSGVLYLPVTRRFEFYARAGTGVGWVRDRDRRDTNAKPIGTVGAGAQYHLTTQMLVRAGADGYAMRPRIVDGDGNTSTADQRIGVAYVGLSLLF
ncbi:MAG: porin family protein [Ectothiorhodospiraceae bacterium]|nr:porin family protein [Ectothiorhodospiraceae bacterium]MCH8505746.1 porin family protein [Ectothiorhodospiraceae bacterium]